MIPGLAARAGKNLCHKVLVPRQYSFSERAVFIRVVSEPRQRFRFLFNDNALSLSQPTSNSPDTLL